MLDSLRKPAHYTESYVKTKAKVDELMLSKQLLRTLNVKIVAPITRQGPAQPKESHATNVINQAISSGSAGPQDVAEGGFMAETSTTVTTETADAEVTITKTVEEVPSEVLPTEVEVHTEVTGVVEVISKIIQTLEINK